MRNERGNGRVGVFIWLLVVGAALFVAFRTIPVRVAVLKLHDFCDEQTRYAAASNRIDEEQLIKDVLARAVELEVPLDRKQIKFEKRKNEVRLQVKHDVTVDLEVYEWTWKYDRSFEHLRF